MAGTIDLCGYAAADDASGTFRPARPPADRARASAAEDAAQRAAGAVQAEQQAKRRRGAATRGAASGTARRSEILAGWLVALVLLLGIAAWSLVATDHGDRRDMGARPIPRGVPAAIAPEVSPRDELADPRTHDDE